MRNEIRLLSCPIAFSVALVAGCSGGQPLQGYPEKMAEAACAQIGRCCDPAGLQALGREEAVTPQGCRDAVREWYQQLTDIVRELVDAGEIAWDARGAADCLDRVRDTPCDVPSACSLPVIALRNPGDPCQLNESCKRGCCIGEVCSDCRAAGEPCSPYEECAPDLFCMCPGDQPECPDDPGTCQPARGLSEDCSGLFECARNLFCGSDDTCAQRLVQGAPCARDYECQEGLACSQTERVCIPPCSREVEHLGCATPGAGGHGAATLALWLALALAARGRRRASRKASLVTREPSRPRTNAR